MQWSSVNLEIGISSRVSIGFEVEKLGRNFAIVDYWVKLIKLCRSILGWICAKGGQTMNAKITRFEAKRDTEAIEWAKELRETEHWFQSQRFREITRLHNAYEVVALRGTAREEHTIAT